MEANATPWFRASKQLKDLKHTNQKPQESLISVDDTHLGKQQLAGRFFQLLKVGRSPCISFLVYLLVTHVHHKLHHWAELSLSITLLPKMCFENCRGRKAQFCSITYEFCRNCSYTRKIENTNLKQIGSRYMISPLTRNRNAYQQMTEAWASI